MQLRGWLLLKGLAREARHWGPFPEALERRGRKAVRLDLPGVGTERHRKSPRSIEGIVHDLRGRYLELGPGPWGIFAQSLGGMIALEWAARYPRDFALVAVSNTSSSSLSPVHQRLSLKGVQMLLRAGAAKTALERERVVLDLITHTPEARDRAAEFATFAKDAPVRRRNVGRQLLAAAGARAPEAMPVPLLVLASERDQMVSVDCSKELASHYQATLRLHPTAGHELAIDDPEWVVTQLLEFETRSGLRPN